MLSSSHLNTNYQSQSSMPNSPPMPPNQMPKISNSFFVSKKRKANSNENNDGSPFLTGKSSANEMKKRSFFRDNNSSNLVLKARQLHPYYQNQLISMFQILPSNQNGLFAFLESLRQYDNDTVLNVTRTVEFFYQKNLNANNNPITNQQRIIRKQVGMPKLGPIFSYDFNDVRYGYCEQENMILKEPIPIGACDFNFQLQIPDIPDGYHVVIQSFIASVAPPISKWPQSLIVLINGQQVKGLGIFNFPLIDTFEFGPNANIQVHCSQEQQIYAFLIRLAKYQSLKELVSMIQSKNLNDEYFNPKGMSVICPINGKLMKYPGKGIHCTHSQCFDLKEYMIRALNHRNWVCPICRQSTPIEDLFFSKPTYELIQAAKKPFSFQMPVNQNQVQQISQQKLPEVYSPTEKIPKRFLSDTSPNENDDFSDYSNFNIFDDFSFDFNQ